ncbi:diaminopimelate decarboxylase [Priestia flexa]|uniref:diaminopimelate decarboxylase n=1 Tax=Priestia flexa TaxID=86664 RepID=UPI001A8CD855|nr:diaminopimelate decarboxylase [Priestia flexa]MBN8432899.1 diaminopimelate decarboxylase [Priestia flexa]MCA0965115.1 diaminopimelate decarboxylase [Priestia flexa]
MFLHGTSRINEQGHLEIGGVDAVKLGKEFGTPLYVYDIALIRQRARGFKETFEKHNIKAQVAYASKAFSTVAMVQVVDQEGLSLDVVSGGELYTALAANFPKERIHFHGNNKSRAELEMAIKEDIGCIVVDNFYEIALLQELTEQYGKTMPVLLRLTPGIEAHTHDYILTGQEDSKFGFDLQNGQADEAIKAVMETSGINLLGIHCHIGSQIFETTGFVMATQKLFSKMKEWKETIGYVPEVLNLGGGFGIRYTEEDQPIPVSEYVEVIIEEVKKQSAQLDVPIPEIWIEPGRSLVGDAGTTLYSVGSRKHVPNIREYVAIDGGMNDNIRPALYQAKYEAALANRMNDVKDELVSIAGKCCESGDMLMWDLSLPTARPGDILAMFCTGAYGYSMASQYNRLPKPAVVFVEDGDAQLVVQRETYEDIIKNDLKYNVALKK